MIYLCMTILVLGCVGIGAWLVISGHPWFGLFAMIIASGVSVKRTSESSKSSK